jgi:hypothetical protein
MGEPAEEIERLRTLERDRQSPGNFVLYLGKNSTQSGNSCRDGLIALNPCLVSAVSRFKLGALQIHPRIGNGNPLLSYRDRGFLRQFITPVRRSELSGEVAEQVAVYKRLLFLMEYT